MENIDIKTITNKEEFINSIIDKFLNEEVSQEVIQSYYNNSFAYLENKILKSSIPNIFDFIKNNFTKIRLFHNMNHPTGVLLNEVVKEIFKLMDLQYDNRYEDENIDMLNKILNDLVMPILPSVKKYYNLNFQDECSSWYNSNIKDTKTFIYYYINDLYLEPN